MGPRGCEDGNGRPWEEDLPAERCGCKSDGLGKGDALGRCRPGLGSSRIPARPLGCSPGIGMQLPGPGGVQGIPVKPPLRPAPAALPTHLPAGSLLPKPKGDPAAAQENGTLWHPGGFILCRDRALDTSPGLPARAAAPKPGRTPAALKEPPQVDTVQLSFSGSAVPLPPKNEGKVVKKAKSEDDPVPTSAAAPWETNLDSVLPLRRRSFSLTPLPRPSLSPASRLDPGIN